MLYKGITFFRAALILIAVGAIWSGAVFSSSVKNSQVLDIDREGAATIQASLQGKGIGFYQISSNQYDNSILVKVLDSHGNYLSSRTITNRETVNYFFFDQTGQYTLEMSNLSEEPIHLAVEFGDTRYQDLGVSSSMVLVGACLLVLAGYLRLKNYITAQPE